MTKEELAGKLNGREYLHEITKEEEAQAKASGLVVCFGYSDDNLEFRGAIDDEIGAWEGVEALLTPDGLLQNECEDEDCPYFEKLRANTMDKVTAIWDKDGYSWVIETTLPFAPFDVMEGTDKFCRAIVLEIPRSA